jgi:hypothetical protein
MFAEVYGENPETGYRSPFQGFTDEKSFYARGQRKKTLTRMLEGNIYNNMLYGINSSTQEHENYIILCIR